jgi:hypothetical protein
LSLRRVQWAAEEQAAEPERKPRQPTGPERVLSDDFMDKLAKRKQGEVVDSEADLEPTEDDSSTEPKDQEAAVLPAVSESAAEEDTEVKEESPVAESQETSEPENQAAPANDEGSEDKEKTTQE